jgi:hypothetical protein
LDSDRIDLAGFVTGASAGHPAVVFHANQDPSSSRAWPISQADHGFNEIVVRQWSGFLALEFDIKRLSPGDEVPNVVGDQEGSP